MITKSLMDSWLFFKIHILSISMIILPITIPVEIIEALNNYFIVSDESYYYEQLIPLATSFITYPIYAVALVFYISSTIYGVNCETKTLWKLGFKYWVPYTIYTILCYVIIIAGLFLLIIPGFIFAARYTFAEFDLLLNENKPIDSLRNSWGLTKKYVWEILGGYAFITLILYAVLYSTSFLFDEEGIAVLLFDTVLNIILSVFLSLYTIYAFRIYEYAKLNSKNNK